MADYKPKKTKIPSAWWLYVLEAKRLGFTKEEADSVWEQLKDDEKAVWKLFRDKLRSGKVR